MVEMSIVYGIRSSMVPFAFHQSLGPRISRNGVGGCPNGGPGLRVRTIIGSLGPGSPLAVIGQGLGQRISVHGVLACADVRKGFVSRMRSTLVGGLGGLGRSVSAIGPGRRRSGTSPLRNVSAGSKLEDEREESSSSSQDTKAKNVEAVGDKKGGLVESIEAELGRQFGGALWFSVLLVCLAVFGGGYAFLIFNYADLSDIPILRGPQR